MNIIVSLYKLSGKLKDKVFAVWVSYAASIGTEMITEASSFSELSRK